MSRPVFGPHERLNLDFASATIDVAQHPSAGVAKVGARAARFALDGVMSPAGVAAFAPDAREMRENVGLAAASHRLARAYGIPRGALLRSVPFAFNGLVLGSLTTAGAEFNSGANGVALPEINVPTDEQHARYTELLRNPAELRKFGNALGNFAGVIANPMSNAQGALDTYHSDLTRVSAEYADRPTDPARFAELGAVRDELATGLRHVLLDALPANVGDVAGPVLVENVLRHNPGGDLLAAHFPQA